MTNGALGLPADSFWGSYEQKNTGKDALLDRIVDDGLRGLIADAPPQVNLANRETLPILAYFIRDIRDDVYLDQWRQLFLIGSDHETHAVRVVPALFSEKVHMPKGPPPPGDPGPGAVIDLYDIDAAARLGIVDLPGCHSFRLIFREWASDPLEVELIGSGYHDNAAEQLVAERRRSNPPPPAPVWPPVPERRVGVSAASGRSYPRYGDKAQAPAPPAELGVSLEVDRAVVSNERCMLRGSFRLATLPRERVAPTRLYAGERERRTPPVGDAAAKAVVPLTLVLTGSVEPGPFMLSLQLPAYELIEDGDQHIAVGAFEIDLFELRGMPRAAQTLFLHAFNGGHCLGPLAIGVVSPEMIR